MAYFCKFSLPTDITSQHFFVFSPQTFSKFSEKISKLKNPRIIMSTIHGAKGGEADKVLLMQDVTNAALEKNVKSISFPFWN